MTNWTPQLDAAATPRYQALADAIARDVATGVLQPGMRLPTHRDLADMLGVNVTTVTRGYAEAERRGLVSGTVGRGTFIAVDATTPPTMVSFEPQTPGGIELGLVKSLTQLDPDLSQALKRLLRRQNPESFLDYKDPRGMPAHREAGALLARRYGLPAALVTAEDMLVTAGSQHALLCCLMTLFKPGERIATDAMTYPGLKGMAATLGLRLVPIAMDEAGMLPEALDAACRRGDLRGLYVLPEMHNPTTYRLPDGRRDALAGLARRYGLTVIEDDAYALTLPPTSPPSVPLSARIPEQSVFLVGVSKVMGAGLRVGYLRAAPAFRLPLASSILHSIWMVPPLNAEIVSDWITSGVVEDVLAAKRCETQARLDLACSILAEERLAWREAGYYCWWTLPEGVSSKAVENRAMVAGVNVFGAEKFAVGDAVAPNCLRVSLTGTGDVAELRDGLERVLAVVRSEGVAVRCSSERVVY